MFSITCNVPSGVENELRCYTCYRLPKTLFPVKKMWYQLIKCQKRDIQSLNVLSTIQYRQLFIKCRKLVKYPVQNAEKSGI